MHEKQLEQETYEVTVSDTDKIAQLASEHDLTRQEVIEQMVREYSTIHDEEWVVFNENIDQLEPTESLVFYPGKVVRNVLLLLGVLYGMFVFLIMSLMLPIVGNDIPVSTLELVATVGFLLMSLFILLVLALILQTTIPERIEQRYLD